MFRFFTIISLCSCLKGNPNINLDEIYAFGVTNREEASALLKANQLHFHTKYEIIKDCWPEWIIANWRQVMKERELIFELLEEILDESRPLEGRLHSLKIFRCVLGESNYNERILPPIFPSYSE